MLYNNLLLITLFIGMALSIPINNTEEKKLKVSSTISLVPLQTIPVTRNDSDDKNDNVEIIQFQHYIDDDKTNAETENDVSNDNEKEVEEKDEKEKEVEEKEEEDEGEEEEEDEKEKEEEEEDEKEKEEEEKEEKEEEEEKEEKEEEEEEKEEDDEKEEEEEEREEEDGKEEDNNENDKEDNEENDEEDDLTSDEKEKEEEKDGEEEDNNENDEEEEREEEEREEEDLTIEKKDNTCTKDLLIMGNKHSTNDACVDIYDACTTQELLSIILIYYSQTTPISIEHIINYDMNKGHISEQCGNILLNSNIFDDDIITESAN